MWYQQLFQMASIVSFGNDISFKIQWYTDKQSFTSGLSPELKPLFRAAYDGNQYMYMINAIYNVV